MAHSGIRAIIAAAVAAMAAGLDKPPPRVDFTARAPWWRWRPSRSWGSNKTTWHEPGTGKRQGERIARQIRSGQLTKANGLVRSEDVFEHAPAIGQRRLFISASARGRGVKIPDAIYEQRHIARVIEERSGRATEPQIIVDDPLIRR